MKFNENSLPNDPEQLKQMLLERYNLKLAKEYGKKSEKRPGADEVFNEVELVLDEVDKKLLADSNSDATKSVIAAKTRYIR